LTVEFQGGDPLLRYDLVKTAIEYISEKNKLHNRLIRFVVTTTLHQLTSEMCSFFKEHQVVLSTSIDGVADLHNKNRP
ncbi:His-Xaa-Ser system radical SAM maturase HxsB, partial [Acinetobacter baumannii]